MNLPKWLIDQHMIDHNEQDILGALRALGCEVHVGSFERWAKAEDLPLPFSADDCVVVYGSQEFINQHKKHGYIPGVYCQDGNLTCTEYMAQISDPSLLLNSDRVFVPFADFARKPDFFYRALDTEVLFVRPNTGRKLFTGIAIGRVEFVREMSCLKQLHPIGDSTLVMIAPGQKIEAEYRLVIANRQVIGASRYLEQGNISLQEGAPEHIWETAQRMAYNDWQPDVVYVCDVADTQTGAKIVELNAFASSGLYLCPLQQVFSAVNEAAVLEWQGDISLGDLAPVPAVANGKRLGL